MKLPVKISAIAFAAALLAACTPATITPSENTFSLSETQLVAKDFRDMCLKTLPTFAGFTKTGEAKGYKRENFSGLDNVSFVGGDKKRAVVLAEQKGGRGCGVAFFGPEDTAGVGATFLKEAQRATRGNALRRIDHDFFSSVYRLRNGSLLTHLVRRKRGGVRHIILISPPLRDDQVAAYIYD